MLGWVESSSAACVCCTDRVSTHALLLALERQAAAALLAIATGKAEFSQQRLSLRKQMTYEGWHLQLCVSVEGDKTKL
jgi:hypothetical protein